jgi:hypothetical protein
MTNFLHISQTAEPLTRELFEKKIHSFRDYIWGSLMPEFRCLFLSKVIDDIDDKTHSGYGKSEWLIHCEEANKTEWLDKHFHYYDIDFEKHNILVIDNKEQLINFFELYGDGKIGDMPKPIYMRCYSLMTKEETIIYNIKEKEKLQKKLLFLKKYFDKYLSKREIAEEFTEEVDFNLQKTIVYDETTNDYKMIIPKRGFSPNRISILYDYYKKLSTNYIDYLNEIDIETEKKNKQLDDFLLDYLPFYKVDYKKVREIYNGIYFTSNMSKDIINTSTGYASLALQKLAKQLESDTLVIMNWIFD